MQKAIHVLGGLLVSIAVKIKPLSRLMLRKLKKLLKIYGKVVYFFYRIVVQ